MDDPDDVAKIPAYMNGYYPEQFARAENGYEPNGLIGRSADYNAYKAAMEQIRDERKRRRGLLTEKEKMLIRARNKMWNAGKRAVREKLKAVKEQLERDQLQLGMDEFKTDLLGKYYTDAWEAERKRAPDFYKDVDVQDLINEITNPTGKSWFQKGWEAANAVAARTKENMPAPDVWHGVELTNRGQHAPLAIGPYQIAAPPAPARTAEEEELDRLALQEAARRRAASSSSSSGTQRYTTNRSVGGRKRKAAASANAGQDDDEELDQQVLFNPPPPAAAAADTDMGTADSVPANGWGWGWY